MAAPTVSNEPDRADHIVDTLIRERAPRLAGSPLWPLVRPALHALLSYRQARALVDAVAEKTGRQALDYGSQLLRLKVEARGLERISRHGRLIVVVNHPTGLADGVAIDDALRPIRPDLIFFANADAHRVNPRLDEVFIPVEWVEAKRTRERTRLTVTRAQAALQAERLLIIFPAGRISRRTSDGGLSDPAWASSALSLARRYKAQIAPIHLAGPPSHLFRLFDRIWGELRDITLFHELLNKRGRAFQLTVGPLIPWQAVDDPAETTARLKTYVERILPFEPDRPFA